MELTCQSHPTPEDFDAYALGMAKAAQLDAFEEHLLACEGCRRRLDETEEDIRVLKIVLRTCGDNLTVQ